MESCVIQVQSCANKEQRLVVRVLSHTPFALSGLAASINHFQSNTSKYNQINNNRSRVFKLVSCTSRSGAQVLDGTFVVRLESVPGDQFAILSKLDAHDHYILNFLDTPLPPADAALLYHRAMDDTTFIDRWISPVQAVRQNDLKLTMRPPTLKSYKPLPDGAELDRREPVDPFDYFLEKYFGSLYQVTTSLAYFAKSSFSGLRAISKDEEVYESTLKQFIVDIDTFDSRHLPSNNGLLNAGLMYEKENIYRREFIENSLNLLEFDVHSTMSWTSNKVLSRVVDDFKIREIHLQILLLLELVHITRCDTLAKLEKKDKKTHSTKRKLVGRRKLTPTLSGTAITTTSPQNSVRSKLTYTQILGVYIDKLCIWNALMGTSSKTDHSTAKFITYIVNPYYSKKCPNIVRHMVSKIKGQNFKIKKASPMSDPITSTASASRETSIPLSDTAGSRKINSTGVDNANKGKMAKPSLVRTNSILRLEDMPDFKLSRNNSDLQNLKRISSFNSSTLSKREIDMSLPSKPTDPDSLKKKTSFIFNRVGKKVTEPKPAVVESINQVDETPIKPDRFTNIIIEQTPNDSNNTIHSSSPISYRQRPTLTSPVITSPQSIKQDGSTSIHFSIAQTPTMIQPSTKRPGEPFLFTDTQEAKSLGSPIKKNVKRRLFAPRKQ